MLRQSPTRAVARAKTSPTLRTQHAAQMQRACLSPYPPGGRDGVRLAVGEYYVRGLCFNVKHGPPPLFQRESPDLSGSPGLDLDNPQNFLTLSNRRSIPYLFFTESRRRALHSAGYT